MPQNAPPALPTWFPKRQREQAVAPVRHEREAAELWGHTAPFYTLNANSTATGTLVFYPYAKAVPIARLHRPTGLPNPAPALGLAVASWFALVVLGVLSIAGMSACGSNGLSGV